MLKYYFALLLGLAMPACVDCQSAIRAEQQAPTAQRRTGRIDQPLVTDSILENLSKGAIFRFEIAPNLPQFTFKVIPEIRDDDEHGFPRSTVRDIEVFRGDSKQPLQHLSGCDLENMEPPLVRANWFHKDDLNFDGYQDVYLMTHYGASGNQYGCVWLYNRTTGHFDYSKVFSELPRYWLDAATKTIWTFDKGGMAGTVFVASKYKVENDRPVLIWSAKQDWDGGKEQFHCVEQERRQGEMVTTHDVWKDSGQEPPCYIPMIRFQPADKEK